MNLNFVCKIICKFEFTIDYATNLRKKKISKNMNYMSYNEWIFKMLLLKIESEAHPFFFSFEA